MERVHQQVVLLTMCWHAALTFAVIHRMAACRVFWDLKNSSKMSRCSCKLLALVCYAFLLPLPEVQASRWSQAATADWPAGYSCEAIAAIPQDQRCAFVSLECESDSRLPYTQWYYCSVAPHGWWAKGLFVLMLLVMLPLLFTALGDTAELYFSPTMSLIAQTIPGMRPRFAGVTFVAVGNGAPDLSANISALRTGQVALCAGAFTGAAMFVQCVVASEVIRISGGVKCRGATLRDVGVYAVSVAGVCLALHSGKVTQWFVAGTTLTYLAYVAWVFLGDEWHARGRPELRPGLGWKDLHAMLLRRQQLQRLLRLPHARPITQQPSTGSQHAAVDDSVSQALLPWAAVDEDVTVPAPDAATTATAARPTTGSEPFERPSSGLLGSHAYRQAVWADLGWEASNKARRQIAVELGTGGREGGGISSSDDEEGDMRDGGGRYWGPEDGRQPEIEQQGLLGQDGLEAGRREKHGSGEGEQELLTWQQQLWKSVCAELTLHSSSEWNDLPAWRRHIRQSSFSALLPLYAALRLSIPQVDPETYNQQWLVASMLCCPLAVLAYFGAFSLGNIIAALVVGACGAVTVHILTRDEPEMPRLDCGTRMAFGPALVSLVGFFMGVLWIDSLASEAVGVVTLLSGLLGVPASLAGLTMLAWGNSLGDFFSNQAMARRGASSTAFTACFAAPLFNMLLSMALGFSAYFAKEHTHSAPVSLPHDAALGCVALIIYNIVLAVVGFVNNNSLPERFYLFARIWYALYLVAAGLLAVTTSSGTSS